MINIKNNQVRTVMTNEYLEQQKNNIIKYCEPQILGLKIYKISFQGPS